MCSPPLFNLALRFSISAVAILFSFDCFFIIRSHPLAAGVFAVTDLLPTGGFPPAPCLRAGLGAARYSRPQAVSALADRVAVSPGSGKCCFPVLAGLVGVWGCGDGQEFGAGTSVTLQAGGGGVPTSAS